jgi:membrane fusion protein (multidrug efflux system)
MMSFRSQPPIRRRVPQTRNALLLCAAAAIVAAQLGCGDSIAANAAPDAARQTTSAPKTRLRVRVEPVRLARLAGTDRVTGTVRAFHRATITAETQGQVLARTARPGAAIQEGGVIVELESSRLELETRRAEASLSAARTVLRYAERELARGEQLRKQNAISIQRHDDLRHAVDRSRDEVVLSEVARDTARRNLEDTRVTAPFSGTVDSIAVNVGDFVAPGTPVATLVDLSRVRIFGGVTAREAARLGPGTTARVSFADLGGALFEATLESVGRVAGEMDGTYGIELWMEDPDGRMRDGMVAQIELLDPEEEPSLLARRAALVRRNGHPEVFIVEGHGDDAVARSRRLRTGRSQGQWVEILDGLEEGDRVVWDGHFALADGTAVALSSTDDAGQSGSVADVKK